MERRCHECREFRPVEEFPVKLKTKSGRGGICLTCRPEVPPEPAPFTAAQRVSMCERKKRYSTYEFALGVASKAAEREVLIRVYECPICQGFHLTHQPSRRVS